eukprot:1438292-Rhodomonas_salina.2
MKPITCVTYPGTAPLRLSGILLRPAYGTDGGVWVYQGIPSTYQVRFRSCLCADMRNKGWYRGWYCSRGWVHWY